jgi:hypothetical protein
VSDRGHGRYGFRSGLRPFGEFQEESARRKDTFIRMTSGEVLNSVWFNSGMGSPNYFHTFDHEHNHRTLDVVGVRMLDYEPFTRVDSQAELTATAGSFRYARDPGGLLQLGVHLPDNSSPSSRNVLIISSWHNATGAAKREHLVHPTVGRERLLNFDLDTWAGSPAQPSDWTFESTVGVGASIVEQAAGIGDGTTYAAKIHGNGGGVVGTLRQSVSLIVPPFDLGPWGYRFWGSYLTPKTILASQGARIRVSDRGSPEAWLAADGRSLNGVAHGNSSVELELKKTRGKMRLYCLDFIGHVSPLSFELVGYSNSANEFDVYFGRTSLRKIHGWDWYEPNIAPGGLPEIYEGASDPLPGSEATGAGAITLLNDGRALMEDRFSYPYVWPSRDVEVLLGGAFEGGQEILFFDMHPAFRGVINGPNSPRVNPRQATVAVESYRQIFEATLPPRTYDISFTEVEESHRNRPRPLVFGFEPHTQPAGTEYVPSSPLTGYRRYELCDTTDWPAGIAGVSTAGGKGSGAWAYPDEESAAKQRPDVRVELFEGVHFTQDKAAGTVDVIHDIRVFEVTAENNKLEFDDGSFNYVVTIPPGWYVIGNGPQGGSGGHDLLEVIRAEAVSLSGITSLQFVYDEVTHLCTIGSTGKISINFHRTTSDGGTIDGFSILPLLGFDSEDVVVSGTQYTGTIPLFESTDAHIARWDVEGFVDPTGRFTGIVSSPPSLVVLWPDILRMILEVFLAQPSTRYHLAEFEAARLSCPQVLALYLGGLGDQPSTLRVSEIVDRFENGSPTVGEGPAEIRLDGEGRFRFLKRTSTVPDDVPHIREHDLVELIDGGFDPAQCYRFTEVRFARDASTGAPKSSRLDSDFVRLAFQNDKPAIFETFLTEDADADAARDALAALTRSPIRHFTLVVKAKALRSLKGDLIRLTVPQALRGASDAGPGLDGAVFRIESKKLQPETQRVVLVVFTNIIT